jgi:hypothetical protein
MYRDASSPPPIMRNVKIPTGYAVCASGKSVDITLGTGDYFPDL